MKSLDGYWTNNEGCFGRLLAVKRPVSSHNHRAAPQSAEFRVWSKSLEFMNEINVGKTQSAGKQKKHYTEKEMRLVLFTGLLLKVKNNNKSDASFSG